MTYSQFWELAIRRDKVTLYIIRKFVFKITLKFLILGGSELAKINILLIRPEGIFFYETHFHGAVMFWSASTSTWFYYC